MDRLLLAAAALCLMAGFGQAFFALGARSHREGSVWTFVAVISGFALLTAFLVARGRLEGSCPLNSLFDVLVFLSWALLLTYVLVGAPYRLSLLGAFTSPLAMLLLLAALLTDATPHKRVSHPWIEFHAAVSLIAYGAFGLAAVAGLMYLIHEKQLKAHVVSPLFYQMPPIAQLSSAIGRLIWLGFAILSLGLAAGFLAQLPVNGLKFTASVIIWCCYGALLVGMRWGRLAPRRSAIYGLAIFGAALMTLPAIQYLSSRP